MEKNMKYNTAFLAYISHHHFPSIIVKYFEHTEDQIKLCNKKVKYLFLKYSKSITSRTKSQSLKCIKIKNSVKSHFNEENVTNKILRIKQHK